MAEDQIAFARLRDAGDGVRSWIHLVEPTSAAVRPLTPAELSLYDPYWSPDGSRLVALGGDQLDPWPQVYVIDAASGESDRISNDGALKLHPVWSPDGSEILLELSVGASGYHLFAIGLVSGSLRQITGPSFEGQLPPALPEPGAVDYVTYEETRDDEPPDVEEMPTWSPDGRVIAFVRLHTRPRRNIDDSGFDHHIWTVSADGSDERQLSDGPVHDLEPVYSPDGTRIAFTRYVDGEIIRKGRSGHSAVRLCVMNADGTGLGVLTEEPAGYSSPSWSSDGTTLVCSRSMFGPSHLFVLDADGSHGHAITHPDEDGDYDPAWRPSLPLFRPATPHWQSADQPLFR